MKLERVNAVLESNICVNDGDCFYDCETCGRARNTLKEYAKAEEQGILIKLPCKVGDTVFNINQAARISAYYVTNIQCDNAHNDWYVLLGFNTIYHISEFGKTVFLTKEEAEQALKGLEG